MDVDALKPGPDRPQHLEVVVAVEVRVDAPLQADLGGARLLRLDDAPGDLVDLEQVGAAPQVQRQRTLGESAEPALEGADVGVVDVPVGDEGDHVADRSPAQLVGDLGHGHDFGPAGREQRDDLVLADLLARERARRAPRPRPRRPEAVTEVDRAVPGSRWPLAGSEAGAGAAPSPPEHQLESRARPSASERSMTA